VVRLHLMRNTVQLVSARDGLDWRALFYPLHATEFRRTFAAVAREWTATRCSDRQSGCWRSRVNRALSSNPIPVLRKRAVVGVGQRRTDQLDPLQQVGVGHPPGHVHATPPSRPHRSSAQEGGRACSGATACQSWPPLGKPSANASRPASRRPPSPRVIPPEYGPDPIRRPGRNTSPHRPTARPTLHPRCVAVPNRLRSEPRANGEASSVYGKRWAGRAIVC
jgi:hypothetical protein